MNYSYLMTFHLLSFYLKVIGRKLQGTDRITEGIFKKLPY